MNERNDPSCHYVDCIYYCDAYSFVVDSSSGFSPSTLAQCLAEPQHVWSLYYMEKRTGFRLPEEIGPISKVENCCIGALGDIFFTFSQHIIVVLLSYHAGWHGVSSLGRLATQVLQLCITIEIRVAVPENGRVYR